jgi:glycosyltransferase involved in cell wall biosynthesis
MAPYWDRIDVLTPGHKEASPAVLLGNVYIHPSPRSRFVQRRFVVELVDKLVRERHYSIAISHDHGIFSNGFAAMEIESRFGIPYISEIHHVPGHPRAGSLKEFGQKCMARYYISRARNRATAFRAVNNTQMPALLEAWGVPPDKIVILPSFYLDFDLFYPGDHVKASWDVMFCGRLDSNKGLDLLASAASLVTKVRPNTRFLVIGDGSRFGALESDLKKRGITERFEIHRWLDSPYDLADCYRRSNLLLCTSYSEGGPRVCLEAMACGTPVISTPVGIMPEVLSDGFGGRLVTWDANNIATSVLEILNNPLDRNRMGSEANQIVQPFNQDKTLRNYVRTYIHLAEECEGQGPL